VLHEPLDGAPLAGSVAALEHNDVLGGRVLRPVLELQQLDLQLILFLLVAVPVEPLRVGVVLAPGLHRAAPRVDQIWIGQVLVVLHAVTVAQQMVQVLTEVLMRHTSSIDPPDRTWVATR
jgi:hypothetical protein